MFTRNDKTRWPLTRNPSSETVEWIYQEDGRVWRLAGAQKHLFSNIIMTICRHLAFTKQRR